VPESTTFIGGAGGITGGSDTGWYIIDTSNQQSVLEIAYLRGVQTPTIEQTESDFNSLGMQFRVFFDFGVAKLEPRAGAYSDGTAT
jgi:hypothetical protein